MVADQRLGVGLRQPAGILGVGAIAEPSSQTTPSAQCDPNKKAAGVAPTDYLLLSPLMAQ